MAPTSMWAQRAFAVWRGTQTARSTASLGTGLRSSLRYSSTAAASSPSSSSPPEVTDSAEESKTEHDPDAIPFSSLSGKINPSLLQALTQGPFKYTTMSAVQSRILPMLPGLTAPRLASSSPTENEKVENLDLLVKARTGTGKTIGFLVPAIEARLRQLDSIASIPSSVSSSEAADSAPHQRTPSSRSNSQQYARDTIGVLVISPTRELASQIAVESQKLTTHLSGSSALPSHDHRDIRDRNKRRPVQFSATGSPRSQPASAFTTHLFVGGVDKQKQIRDFYRARKDVVVATPGRLRDLIEDERSGVKKALVGCQFLILDEADTLLDMGFRDDIEDIIKHLPSSEPSEGRPGRQTFLFSATVSPSIQSIASKSLHPTHHTFINCVSPTASDTHIHIPQFYTSLPSPSSQLPHLARLVIADQLQFKEKSKIVMFLPTTKQTILFAQILKDLSRELGVLPERRTEVFELHSKRTMQARTRAADAFRQSRSASVLVTSDVSARGVDYPGVTRVIQLGLPKSAEQYVHRVGRTGRGASKEGRGDLVLLDWEREYTRRNYSHLPLKPLSTADFAEEVQGLVEEKAGAQYKAVYAELEKAIEEYKPRVDGEMVSESMASQAGFYAGLAGQMGMSIDGIVEALKRWTTEGMGLSRAPYISASMLAKLGAGRGDRRSSSSSSSFTRGGDRGGYGSRSFGHSDRSGGGGYGGGDRHAARRSGERTAGVYGQKREWRDDSASSSFGERKPYQRREFDGERKPFQRREFDGERKPFGERREFGSEGERKPFQRREFGADGERKLFVRREFGADGERKPFVRREYGGDGERKPFQRRDGGERGERKPFVKREKEFDFDFGKE